MRQLSNEQIRQIRPAAPAINLSICEEGQNLRRGGGRLQISPSSEPFFVKLIKFWTKKGTEGLEEGLFFVLKRA